MDGNVTNANPQVSTRKCWYVASSPAAAIAALTDIGHKADFAGTER